MRVAVDCHMVAQESAGDAGNARYAALLAQAMAATGTSSDHVTALATNDRTWEAVGRTATATVAANDFWRLGRGATRTLASLDTDVAAFTYVAPPRLPCALLLAVHDPSFVTNPEWLSPRARAVLNAAVPRSARAADLVLALSQTAKADLCAALALDPDRVVVVSPPADPVFAPREGAAERVRERFGLERFVVAVGDLGPRKNLPALAAAMDILDAEGLELALVGAAGRDGNDIAARTRARWLGRVSDEELADLYTAAAATAYPSLYEGFGLPVVEALACGSPVVASARGAIPEVAGEAAILTEPAPGAIAEGIAAALDPSTADRLRAAGPERAGAYTLEAMGDAAWDAARRAAP